VRSSDESNTPSVQSVPNAFSSSFLERFLERDEPPTAGEADAAGPWHIEEVPGRGFGLFRAGERSARRGKPVAVFSHRWLALIAAAVLPGTGRDPLLLLDPDPDANGFRLTLVDRSVVGHFQLFDENLRDGMNNAVSLLCLPVSMAWLLEAAGPLMLERCGAILDERVSAEERIATDPLGSSS